MSSFRMSRTVAAAVQNRLASIGNHYQQQSQQEPEAGARHWTQHYAGDAAAFCREKLDFTPDERQTELLVNPALQHPRVIINWGRQCGKSKLLAARIMHFATVVQPGALILVLGGRGVHTSELVHSLDQFTTALGWPKCPSIAGREIARRFPNGSRVVTATTPTASRCNSAGLLVLDEAAFIPDSVWMTAFPTISATSGSIIVASTPGGTSGLFYDIWNNTANRFPDWLRSRRTAAETPRIAPSVIEESRRLKGDAYTRQEFGCEFLDSGRTLLKRADLERLFGMKSPAGAEAEKT